MAVQPQQPKKKIQGEKKRGERKGNKEGLPNGCRSRAAGTRRALSAVLPSIPSTYHVGKKNAAQAPVCVLELQTLEEGEGDC